MNEMIRGRVLTWGKKANFSTLQLYMKDKCNNLENAF